MTWSVTRYPGGDLTPLWGTSRMLTASELYNSTSPMDPDEGTGAKVRSWTAVGGSKTCSVCNNHMASAKPPTSYLRVSRRRCRHPATVFTENNSRPASLSILLDWSPPAVGVGGCNHTQTLYPAPHQPAVSEGWKQPEAGRRYLPLYYFKDYFKKYFSQSGELSAHPSLIRLRPLLSSCLLWGHPFAVACVYLL